MPRDEHLIRDIFASTIDDTFDDDDIADVDVFQDADGHYASDFSRI